MTAAALLVAVPSDGSSLVIAGPEPSVRDTTPFDAADIDTRPLFEPNAGRFADAVDVVLPTSSGRVLIGDGEIAIDHGDHGEAGSGPRLRFVGADPDVEPSLGDETGPITNYFIGNDPSEWETNVRPAGAVEYSDLLGTTDVRFLAVADGFRFDVQVEPDSDPADLEIDVDAAGLTILEDGRLEIASLGADPLLLSAPVAYQDVDGERRLVDAAFTLIDDRRFGFDVGDYDASLPLVIDPTLDLSTLFGGFGADHLYDVALTTDGDIVAVGGTTSTLSVATGGSYDSSANGSGDVVVTKFSEDGSSVVWSTYVGGSGFDEARSVELAADGSIVVAGYSQSVDFPTTPGAFDTTLGGANDAIVFRLSPAGTALNASTFFGGSSDDYSPRMVLDSNGDVIVGIDTTSTDFPTTVGAFDTVKEQGGTIHDPAVVRLSADLTTLDWSTLLGGVGDDFLRGLDLDATDRVYVMIDTADTALTVSGDAFDTTHNGMNDLWIGRFDPTATALEFATYLGGPGDDGFSGALAVESPTRIHLGASAAAGFPTTANAAFATGAGADTAYAVLDPSQSGAAQLHHGTFLGGTNDGYANAIIVDAAGRAYIAGDNSTAGLATAGAPQAVLAGGFDAFLTIIDPVTGTRELATYLGGSGFDAADGVALDATGRVLVVGFTSSADFSTTAGAHQLAPGGGGDGFVARFGDIPGAVVDSCAADTDADGLWDCEEDANADADGDPATNPGPNTDGDGLVDYLDDDDDGDGTPTAAENPDPNGDGDPRDAGDGDLDGQPDYLDDPTLASDFDIASTQEVSDGVGGMSALSDGDYFGRQTTAIGDIDGDGVVDLLAGAPGTDDGGSDRGAAYVLFMNADGTARSTQKIGTSDGGLVATLSDNDFFGESLAGIGDLDGDGRSEVVVAAPGDNDNGAGAVYVLFLNADGTVRDESKISNSTPLMTLDPGDFFGEAVAGIGDVNGDGVRDIAIGALFDGDGGPGRGAVHIVFLTPSGGVAGTQTISDTAGGFVGVLGDNDQFGSGVGAIGDVDGDGVDDLAVGARGANAVFVLFLETNGTVRAHQEISDTDGALAAAVGGTWFGRSVSGIGDIDADGVPDIAVGAPSNDTGGANRGAVHLLLLQANGEVKAERTIDSSALDFGGALADGDELGTGVGPLGDLDQDGTLGVIVTARGDDGGGSDRGGVFVLDLAAAGAPASNVTVNSTRDGSDTAPGDDVCDTGGINSEGAAECTLRAAIEEANASALVDTIEFAIPVNDPGHVYYRDNGASGFGSPVVTTLDDASIVDFDADYPGDPFSWWNIATSGPFPATTASVTIDGTTQPGWRPNTGLGGDPTDAILPIVITGDTLTLLEIGGSGSTIRGLNLSGANSSATVLLLAGSGGHTVAGSWAQIDPTGSANGSGDDGIWVQPGSNGNQLGGPDPADRVLIGNGFSNSGISITSNGNTVQNVWIGAQATGSDLLPGSNDIPLVVAGDDNVIGTTGAGVVVSTSLNDSLIVNGDRNTVQASAFGFLPDGTTSDREFASVVGNDNIIGGVVSGQGNAFSVGDSSIRTALTVSGGTGNSVLGNTFIGALGLIIDVGPTGAEINDAFDADSGDNDLLNHPVITAVVPTGPTADVDFELDVPAGAYRIEFYADDTEPRNPSGFGAGQTFVGAVSIVHTGSGLEAFQATITDLGGYWLGATTTEDLGGGDFGSTSEFGPTDCVGDSDGDGLCDGWEAQLGDTDGDGAANELDADDDDDLIPTVAEGADPNGDRDPRDALDSDRDGEPDYLDLPTGAAGTQVVSETKISDLVGGLTASLADGDNFGSSVASIGDLDGDGIVDLAVGAAGDADGGAVYVLFMNADGTVRTEAKISAASGGFTGPVDGFGGAVASIGDLDGDGTPDLAVGAPVDDDGGNGRGSVFVLKMNRDGTVKDQQQISSTAGGFSGPLEDGDLFGWSLSGVGDLDGDGIGDLAISALGDDDGGTNVGAVYVVLLNVDGTVKAEQKLSALAGDVTATLEGFDNFGWSVSSLGDLDGDGRADLAIGAALDDDGAFGAGAVHIVFLNPDGTVKAEQKISAVEGGLVGPIPADREFGTATAGVGDIDADGTPDLVVGASRSDIDSQGEVWVLLLEPDGTVKSERRIGGSTLAGGLDAMDLFASALTGLGDLDGDGSIGFAAGAVGDDDGGPGRGAVYVFDLGVPVWTVNSTDDDADASPGDGRCDTGGTNVDGATECTLRAAVEEANATGTSEIEFDIPLLDTGRDPGGFWRITPLTSIPRITATVSIDGTTQPGYSGDPVIELTDGASISSGLEVDGSSSEVIGLSVTNFSFGIRVGAGGTVVQSNWVGVGPDGVVGGVLYGILVDGGSGATIGGALPGEGNVVVRAYTSGVWLGTGSSVVQGNSIGRLPSGVVSVMDVGIEVDSSGNLIGGTAIGEGNEVTGSTETASSAGVRVDGGTGTSILGNTISGNNQNVDLGGDGRTLNDPLDADTGPNDRLNTPELAITATIPVGPGTSSIDLDVTLDVPAGDYRVEIFDGVIPNFGGEGDAAMLVHTATISHPGGGAQVFAMSYVGPDPGYLSATATEAFGGAVFGSTSELSSVVGVLAGATLVVNSTGDAGDGNLGDGLCDTLSTNSLGAPECTLRAAIEEANRGLGITVEFAMPPSEPGYVATDEYWAITQTSGDWEHLVPNGIAIDGSTQVGYDGTRPVVYLEDDLVGSDLLTIGGDDVTVRAIALGRPGDDGIQLEGDRVTIDGVWIGLDPAGRAAGSTSNAKEGVIVYDGSTDGVITNSRIANLDSGIISNSGTIGLTVVGTEIFSNGNGGVVLDNQGRITLLGNSIHDNTGLGIELADNDGEPLLNDPGDLDNGPNDQLNQPVLGTLTLGAGTADVDFSLDVPVGTYRVEFFDSANPDPTGFGEGQTFLSAETIVHPGGDATYTATVAAGVGSVLSATVTPDLGGGTYGGTSEFSNAGAVGVAFVNSTGDAGDFSVGDGRCDTNGVNADGRSECTLRAALEEAAASSDLDEIHFLIPQTDPGFVAATPSYWRIAPATVLPIVNDVSLLDATTQPGWIDTPVVQLDGIAAITPGTDGLFAATGMTIRGLSITNWVDEGVVVGVDGVTLESNWFGVDPTGAAAPNLGADLIAYGTTTNLTVGGSSPGDGNLFAAGGVDDGVLLANDTSGVLIENNRFGVTPAGDSGLGTTVAEHVVVADNARDVTVRTNQFGDAPNAAVAVTDAADGVVIVGNVFGTDAPGIAVLPIGQALYASTSGSVRFGGTNNADHNRVRNSLYDALLIDAGQTGDVTVLGNSIAGSGELAIDLVPDGETLNDAGDADAGPNGLLNFPEITSATTTGPVTSVAFELDVPAGDYRVEVFANPGGADPSGYGEGEDFLGGVTFSHPGGGARGFSIDVPAGAAALSLTTTEDLGGGSFGATSEFSGVVDPVNAPTVEDLSRRLTDTRPAGGFDPAAVVPGIAGDGLAMEGAASRLVGPATDIAGTELTLSAWVELDTFASDPRVVSKGTGANVVYELWIDDATAEAVARLQIGGGVREVRGGTITVGTFHHLVAVWDGATLALFVDGVQVDAVTAVGGLATDLAAPLVIGNTSTGAAGLDGTVDQVEIHHRPLSSGEILARYRNGSDPAATVSLGGVQTNAPAPWTTSGTQARTGGNSLAAPAVTVGSDAWVTATGIDEPGVEMTAWWWVSDATAVEIAGGTRTGAAPTDQFDVQASATGLDLAVLDGALRTGSDTDPTVLTSGSWRRVVMSTDELGVTSFSLDGATLLGPVVLAGGASGSVGFRAGDLGPGEQWFIDDVQLRRLVSDEPVTSLGPIERN